MPELTALLNFNAKRGIHRYPYSSEHVDTRQTSSGFHTLICRPVRSRQLPLQLEVNVTQETINENSFMLNYLRRHQTIEM